MAYVARPASKNQKYLALQMGQKLCTFAPVYANPLVTLSFNEFSAVFLIDTNDFGEIEKNRRQIEMQHLLLNMENQDNQLH